MNTSPTSVVPATLPPPGPPKAPLTKDQQKLAAACPSATPQELGRFLTANNDNLKKAEKHLRGYLEWRQTCGIDDPPEALAQCASSAEDFHSCASSSVTEDENDWNMASYAAMALEKGGEDVSKLPILPRLARMDDDEGNPTMLDREGRRIVQLNPAKIDPTLATEETYANCISFYLDRKFSRVSLEKFTLSVDIRGGDGWTNPLAKKIIPFIQSILSVIGRNFPDRLHHCFVWPLPWAAVMIWKGVKVFLDAKTAERVKVLKAPAERDSPPPFDQFEKYIEKSVIERMEKNRLNTITPIKK